MAKRVVSHEFDERAGRPVIVNHQKQVKGQRGVDPESDVHSFKEGPISRLMNRKRGQAK